MLDQIISAVSIPFIALWGFLFPDPTPVIVERVPQEVVQKAERALEQTEEIRDRVDSLGATIPTAIALFEDTLASGITSSATSFILVSGQDITGTSLASSTYGFIIDEGRANEEFVLANCTGTSCTGATRGISPVTGTSSVSSLQFSHRRGASVKITDAPLIPILTRLANGDEEFPNPLKYESGVATTTFTDRREIVSKGYVDDTAFSGAGVISATETAEGVTELSTQTEMASSTVSGSSGPLVLQAQYATSSSPTSGHYVPVTENDGNISNSFLNDDVLLDSDTTGTGSVVRSSANGNALIATSTADTTVATTTETTVFSTSIAGGTLGIGNALNVRIPFTSGQIDDGASITFRVKYGGTTIGTVAYTYDGNGSAGVFNSFLDSTILASSTTSSQEGFTTVNMSLNNTLRRIIDSGTTGEAIFMTGAAVGVGTASVDSTTSQTLAVTVQFSAAVSSTITSNMAIIEHLR